MRMRVRSSQGQASPEWLGVVLLVALALAGLGLAGVRIPGADFAVDLLAKLRCAVALGGPGCGGPDAELILAYGDEVAELARKHLPQIRYEDGMRALPVDFRSCRRDACADGAESGDVAASEAGESVTAFVRALDCRGGLAAAAAMSADCSGARSGSLYLQYWLYYPGSRWLGQLPGGGDFHADDWESVQVRIAADGAVDSRASSHHGYNHEGGFGAWLSDAGVTKRAGWGPATGRYYVSGGTHAGRVAGGDAGDRWTDPAQITLVPLESLSDQADRWDFAITAPWFKGAYRDPESWST